MYENEARFGTVFDPPIRLQAIPKTQMAQRQLSEFQPGGMPFGLGYGVALITKPARFSPLTEHELFSYDHFQLN